jgi:glycosyltransferase involved in cell wall biosynthesis
MTFSKSRLNHFSEHLPYPKVVRMKLKPRDVVVIVISNATISPQLVEVIKHLKMGGQCYRIYLVATPENPLLTAIEEIGVSVIVLNEVSKYGLYKHLIRMFFSLVVARPTVVLTSGQYATYFTLPVAFILGIRKRIYIRHHSNFHQKYGLRLGLKLDQLMNIFATKIVAVSKIVQDVLVYSESVEQKKVQVIYNGVDLSRFRGVWRPKEKTSGESFFRIGVISRLTEWKGVEYAATAFKEFHRRHPNSSLHIIGVPADSADKVFEILEGLPAQNFQFQSQNLDIPQFLSQMDVLVHVPTELADEAFGIVYIEALASSIPSIFTRSGILNELVNAEKYCSIVNHKDSNAILISLEEIYTGEMTFEPIPADWLSNFELQKQGSLYRRLLEF